MLRKITVLLAGGAALVSALTTGQSPSRVAQDVAAHAKREGSVVGQPSFTSQELWNLHEKFLTAFMSPQDAVEARKINSTLLAENVQGKIDVTRTFDGRELNTEYLFGLFANLAQSNGISLLGVPQTYKVLNFVGQGNVVSSQIRVMFNFTSLHLTIPVELGLWNVYNADGEILQYSATFKYWQWAVDTLISGAQESLGLPTPEKTVAFLTGAIAQNICDTAQTNCKGDNEQYTSNNDCLAFLTQKIRFGQAYELGRNTLLCRSVHQNMVPFRPDVHCSHIGKTGGGMCADDKTYLSTVADNYFTNAPFVMQGIETEK